MNEPHESKHWVLVARLIRPRGNKGEVLAELLTDFPSRFSKLEQVYLRVGSSEPRAARLQTFWMDQNHLGMGIFHFAECSTIADAEKLRGHEVLLPLEQRVTLQAGQYFVTDLIGCSVFDSGRTSPEASRALGTVRDVFFPGESVAGTPILEVATSEGELLVPLAEDICRHIDVVGRRVDVRLPEGLKNLNSTS